MNHVKQLAEIQEGDSQKISEIKQSQKENAPHGVPHVRLAEKNIGQKCAPIKAKTKWDTSEHEQHKTVTVANHANIRLRNATTEYAQWNPIKEPNEPYKEFEQLAFDAIQQQKDDRTEVLAELQIKLPNKPGTHTLKAKVDTGTEGNTLPSQTFRGMFPNKVDSWRQPLPDKTQKESTVLTAYNNSNMRLHGSVCIQCAYKGK